MPSIKQVLITKVSIVIIQPLTEVAGLLLRKVCLLAFYECKEVEERLDNLFSMVEVES